MAKGLARGVEQAGKIPLQIVEMGADLGSNIYGGLKQDWYRAKDSIIRKFAPGYYAKKKNEAENNPAELRCKTGPMISLSDKMAAGREAIDKTTKQDGSESQLSFKNISGILQFVSAIKPPPSPVYNHKTQRLQDRCLHLKLKCTGRKKDERKRCSRIRASSVWMECDF